jgi:hypothetical protein
MTTIPSPNSIAPFQDSVSQSQTRVAWLAVCLAKAFLACWLLSYLVGALHAAFWFDGYPANGPFQLYDPLRRIAAGQRAGVDFQFFHGIGIPFLHYPLFRLFGGQSLQASELSRQFTSFFLFAATLGSFTWAAFRKSSVRVRGTAWISAALSVMVLELLFRRGAEPGHSLISGRSAMPIFAFALLQLELSDRVKALLTGCCIGCAFLFGTEHGISMTLALLAITAFALMQAFFAKTSAVAFANVKFVAIALGAAALTAATLLLSFCGLNGARGALHYNLMELPGDQFWFFASPPMPYLNNWQQLLFDHHVVLCFLPSLLLLSFLGIHLVRSRKLPLRLGSDWRALAGIMLIYGVLTAIPLIAILSRHYVFPQARIFVLVVVLGVANKAFAGDLKRLAGFSWFRGVKQSLAVAPVLLFSAASTLAGAVLLYHSVNTSWRLTNHLRNDPAPYSRYLDSHWNSFMAQSTALIDANRKRDHVSLWSEYAALLDAHYRTFQPAEDYIIHTVGTKRWQDYLKTFRKTDPEFVTTMTSQFSFAEWLQNERWEFYEDLLRNYRPLKNVEHDTIWQRRPGGWVLPNDNFRPIPFDPASHMVTLPAAQRDGQIVVVKIRYAVENPWRKLPLIGATPRFLAEPQGTPRNVAISFPPYRSEFQFPVKMVAGTPVALRFKVDTFFPNVRFRVNVVEVKNLEDEPGTSTLFTARVIPSRY